MKRDITIRAGEIRQWCFCPKQWYLIRTRGIRKTTPAGKRGIEHHKRESRKVEAVQRIQMRIKTMIFAGGALWLIFWLLS